MPLICEVTLPWSLCQAFGLDCRERLQDLLKFLSPITTASIPLETGFVKELIFPAENAE
jgi:hypothetical protein